MAKEDKRSMESGTLWTVWNGVPSLQPVLDVRWGQNVTIVQNDPIIFRVKEKNAQTGFNPPIWTKNSQKNQVNSKLKKKKF